MSAPDMPQWMTENDDGSVTISFADMKRKPLVDGTEVASLVMREPTLEDQLSQQKAHKHVGDAEVAIIANLLEISPESVRALKTRQYVRCQIAFSFFQSD